MVAGAWQRRRLVVALAAIAALMSVAGVRRTVRLLTRLPRRAALEVAADRRVVRAVRLAHEIAAAADTMPRPPRCLTRSLLLLALLRRRGAPADLHVGVRMDPGFVAHAWVELYGIPVNDHASSVAAHRRLWSLTAAGQ